MAEVIEPVAVEGDGLAVTRMRRGGPLADWWQIPSLARCAEKMKECREQYATLVSDLTTHRVEYDDLAAMTAFFDWLLSGEPKQ